MTERPEDAPLELAKGTSLWADARRRLLHNRAAVVGAAVVGLMALAALFFEVISAHVTHFTFDEQHLSYEPKPVGARSVPEVHVSFEAVAFAAVDADGDGRLSDVELSAALRAREFSFYDVDGDGGLTAADIEASPMNFVGGSAARTVQAFDLDGDGAVSPQEAAKAEITDVFPSWEARAFIRGRDAEGDKHLSPAEFPGLPLPARHWFGTDELGRDLATRVVMGARVSLAVGFIATFVSLLIGVIWGATAGFLGGRTDNLMMRFVDVMYGLPFMFLVILLMVIFQEVPPFAKLILLFVALGAVQWLTMSRIVRGQVISLKNQEFVEAARAMGVPKRVIIFRHLIPNALGPIIVYATLTVPAVMLEEAFLSFLGLGVQAPYASWGSLAADGAKAYLEYPWLIVFPGVALAATLLALNFFGDGLRDALDPRVQKR
jgi:oligopeptide transport system permease protein